MRDSRIIREVFDRFPSHDWLYRDSGDLTETDEKEAIQEGFSSLSGIVDEFEEPEVKGQLFLGNSTVRSQP
jgi:hypothetical protein